MEAARAVIGETERPPPPASSSARSKVHRPFKSATAPGSSAEAALNLCERSPVSSRPCPFGGTGIRPWGWATNNGQVSGFDALLRTPIEAILSPMSASDISTRPFTEKRPASFAGWFEVLRRTRPPHSPPAPLGRGPLHSSVERRTRARRLTRWTHDDDSPIVAQRPPNYLVLKGLPAMSRPRSWESVAGIRIFRIPRWCDAAVDPSGTSLAAQYALSRMSFEA